MSLTDRLQTSSGSWPGLLMFSDGNRGDQYAKVNFAEGEFPRIGDNRKPSFQEDYSSRQLGE